MFSRLLRPFFKPSIFLFGMYTMSNKNMLFCDDNRQIHEILGVAKKRVNFKTAHYSKSFKPEWVIENPNKNWDFDAILKKNMEPNMKIQIYKLYMSKDIYILKKLDFFFDLCFKNDTNKEEREQIYTVMVNNNGSNVDYTHLMYFIFKILHNYEILYDRCDLTYYEYYSSTRKRMKYIECEKMIEILEFIKNYDDNNGIYYRNKRNNRNEYFSKGFYGKIMEYLHDMANNKSNHFITPEFVERYDFLGWDFDDLPPEYQHLKTKRT